MYELQASDYEVAKSLFRHYDVNNNGKIEAKELNQVLSEAGYAPSAGLIHNLLSNLDIDSNGVISKSEFISIFAACHDEETEELLAFMDYDIHARLYHPVKYSHLLPENHPKHKRNATNQIALTKLQAMVTGALTGAITKTLTNPLSRLVILRQVGSENSGNMLQGLIKLSKTEGLTGLWKGNGVNVMKVMPAQAISWGSYTFFKKLFLPDGVSMKDCGPLTQAMSGACSGAVSVSLIYPMDLMRTQLTVRSGDSSLMAVAKETFAKEGIAGFYRGLSVSLSSVIPYIAMNMTLFEQLKTSLISIVPNPGVGTVILSGALAGSLSSTVTYPLDVLRRKLQVQAISEGPKMGAIGTLREVIQRFGYAGLYRGIGPFYAKAVPQAAISFTAFETLKDLLWK